MMEVDVILFWFIVFFTGPFLTVFCCDDLISILFLLGWNVSESET